MQNAGKIVFLALQAQLVILVSAFMMVSTVWSVSCLKLMVPFPPPRAQPFVKLGHLPHVYGVGTTTFEGHVGFSLRLFKALLCFYGKF